MRDIGKNIRALRSEQNMTQQELADKLFVTRQTVSNYESGRSNPDVDMLVKIAEVFETDVSVLIYGKPVPPDQRLAARRFLISLGITLVLAAAALLLYPRARYLASSFFLSAIPLFLRCFVTIPAILLAGLTSMQGLSLCTALRPLDKPWVKRARLALLIALGLVALFLLPYLVYMAVLTAQILQQTTVDSTFPGIPMPVYIRVLQFLLVCVVNQPWLFFPIGAILWLLGFPKYRKTT